jgi:hypothetical protein
MIGTLYRPDLLHHARAFFIGYSWVDGTKLKRRLPAFCPESPWLFCTRFAWQGIKYLGDDADYEWVNEANALPYPTFRYYRCKVQFEALPYRVISDAGLSANGEQDRFTCIFPSDETEWIALDGGQYVYRAPGKVFDTPSGSDTPKSISAFVVKGPTTRVHANRTGLLVQWFDVPEDFVCDRYSHPVALSKAKGTVTKTTFLNRPAGTTRTWPPPSPRQ